MLEAKQKVVTPRCEVLYPYLVTPDNYEGALDYKVNIILDPNEKGVQELIDNVRETAEAQFERGKKELIKKGGKNAAVAKQLEMACPISPEYDDNGDETGRFILKAKSKAAGVTAAGKSWERKIPIFDSGASGKPQKIPHGSVQIWSGSILRVELEANLYTAAGLKLAGVSFYISSVQVIELSSGGSSSSSAFGVEEGGFDAAGLEEAEETTAPDFGAEEEPEDMDF